MSDGTEIKESAITEIHYAGLSAYLSGGDAAGLHLVLGEERVGESAEVRASAPSATQVCLKEPLRLREGLSRRRAGAAGGRRSSAIRATRTTAAGSARVSRTDQSAASPPSCLPQRRSA